MFDFKLYCYDEDNEPFLLFEDMIPFEVKTVEDLSAKFDIVKLLNDKSFCLEDTSTVTVVFFQKNPDYRGDVFALIGTYLSSPEAGYFSEEFYIQITSRPSESREIQNYYKEAAKCQV